MKRLALLVAALVPLASLCAEGDVHVTSTVLTVDQWGRMNVAGVASVSDVATNAANVIVAEAKADAAQQTAQAVTNQLEGIVENIMQNNVVIYRKGYTDSFAGLVIFTDNDKLVICNYEPGTPAGGVLRCRIDFVCTANIGNMKPAVFARDTITGGKADFVRVPSEDVDQPILHNEQKTIGGDTFDKWYEMYVDIDVASGAPTYFYFIKLDADAPSGDGATIELPNGVTGGVTEDVAWGNKVLTFRGGVLTGVRDAD